MPKRSYLERQGIVRSNIKKDLLFFAIPALLVLTTGLVVSVLDGFDGLVIKTWELGTPPENLYTFSALNILGMAIFVVGMTIAFVAVFTLRRSYSGTLVIREDHQLVTHGIYRYTRHPIYLGVLIAILGLPIFAASLYGLLVMSALIPIILNRIRMEERLLTEEFGDVYRDYQETTSKLVPFIY